MIRQKTKTQEREEPKEIRFDHLSLEIKSDIKLFIISMILNKFVLLLSYSMATVRRKFATESSVFHGESWF